MTPTLAALVTLLRARGVVFSIVNEQVVLRPGRLVSPGELAILRNQRRALIRLLQAPVGASGCPRIDVLEAEGSPTSPPAPSNPEAEPEVYVFAGRRVRVTAQDAEDSVRSLGDAALQDYHAGKITKATAYQWARTRRRTLAEWRSPPAEWSHGRPVL